MLTWRNNNICTLSERERKTPLKWFIQQILERKILTKHFLSHSLHRRRRRLTPILLFTFTHENMYRRRHSPTQFSLLICLLIIIGNKFSFIVVLHSSQKVKKKEKEISLYFSLSCNIQNVTIFSLVFLPQQFLACKLWDVGFLLKSE